MAVIALLVETTGLDHDSRDLVGVAVGGGSPVLEVALLLLSHAAGDPDGAAPVGHAGREVVDGGSLVETGQTTLVVLAWKKGGKIQETIKKMTLNNYCSRLINSDLYR